MSLSRIRISEGFRRISSSVLLTRYTSFRMNSPNWFTLREFAPRLNRLSTERNELSMMTWHESVPVATTRIFTRSLNGDINQPRRRSTMKCSSSHSTAENHVCDFTPIQSVRAKWFTTMCARIYCSGIQALLQQNLLKHQCQPQLQHRSGHLKQILTLRHPMNHEPCADHCFLM